MGEKLIEEINKKYNLEVEYKIKLSKVYTISFKLEGKEISFVFMYDSMTSFENNLKEFEHKVNNEIINFYRKKVK